MCYSQNLILTGLVLRVEFGKFIPLKQVFFRVKSSCYIGSYNYNSMVITQSFRSNKLKKVTFYQFVLRRQNFQFQAVIFCLKNRKSCHLPSFVHLYLQQQQFFFRKNNNMSKLNSSLKKNNFIKLLTKLQFNLFNLCLVLETQATQ